MSRNWLRSALLVGLMATGTSAQEGPAYHDDPIEQYDKRAMHGFDVLLSPRLKEHPAGAAASVRELDDQLGRIGRVVPPRPLAELRKIPIWLEWAETDGAAEFHWDPDTLSKQHRNTKKSGAVEITNAQHLVDWAFAQPYMVLHELSHGYQCNVLGKDDRRITRAYDRAMQGGKYKDVEYVTYPRRKAAYAQANKLEYFAEMSETYFGENDFQPWDRAELKTFDPAGHQLMVAVWGEPAAPGWRPIGPPYIRRPSGGGGNRGKIAEQSPRPRSSRMPIPPSP